LSGTAIRTSGAKSAALSTTLISGRLKWEPDGETAETWVDDQSSINIWVDISKASEAWTPQ
jgi:hypothetical protein